MDLQDKPCDWSRLQTMTFAADSGQSRGNSRLRFPQHRSAREDFLSVVSITVSYPTLLSILLLLLLPLGSTTWTATRQVFGRLGRIHWICSLQSIDLSISITVPLSRRLVIPKACFLLQLNQPPPVLQYQHSIHTRPYERSDNVHSHFDQLASSSL